MTGFMKPVSLKNTLLSLGDAHTFYFLNTTSDGKIKEKRKMRVKEKKTDILYKKKTRLSNARFFIIPELYLIKYVTI